MKILILSLLIQTILVENSTVVWRNSYSTHLNQQQVFVALKQSGILKDVSIDGNVLTARVEDLPMDFKGAGFSEFSTSFFISRNLYNAFVTVEYHSVEYEVSVKNIQLEYRYSDGLGQRGEKSRIEEYLLNKKRTEIKSNTKKDVTIIDYTFTKLFTL